jgi:RNA polymerase sigma-70 factor (ECF subfamily)
LELLSPKVIAIVRSTLSEASTELEDVVQDALLSVSQALRSFRGEGKVEHYAARITLRVAIAARKRYRAKTRQLSELSKSPDNLSSAAPSPFDTAQSRMQREALLSLLEDLSEEQAITLGLRVILGYSLQELSNVTGVPLNTVRSRIRLAKDVLRKRIQADPTLSITFEVQS